MTLAIITNIAGSKLFRNRVTCPDSYSQKNMVIFLKQQQKQLSTMALTFLLINLS